MGFTLKQDVVQALESLKNISGKAKKDLHNGFSAKMRPMLTTSFPCEQYGPGKIYNIFLTQDGPASFFCSSLLYNFFAYIPYKPR
jgi:hypothetical protein